jgi:maleate cis-trans isomerase
VGRAVRALGARHIAIVSPYSDEVNQRASRYFAAKHGLETIALEGFGATDSYAIGQRPGERAQPSRLGEKVRPGVLVMRRPTCAW